MLTSASLVGKLINKIQFENAPKRQKEAQHQLTQLGAAP